MSFWDALFGEKKWYLVQLEDRGRGREVKMVEEFDSYDAARREWDRDLEMWDGIVHGRFSPLGMKARNLDFELMRAERVS